MPNPQDKGVSFRQQLKGELDDFLDDEGLICADTATALMTIVAKLSNYTEEGIPLSPEVYICNDIDQVTSVLQGSEIVVIGKGLRDAETADRALRECGPLATGGWAVFIERNADGFRYGVFRFSNLPLSLRPDEALVEDGESDIFAVIARKVAPNCVELVGTSGSRRRLFFSADRAESPAPDKVVRKLCDVIAEDVINTEKEKIVRFCYRTMKEALAKSHGTLIVVLGKRRKKPPKNMADALVFDTPISIQDRILDYIRYADNESMARLQDTANLLIGLMGCDGILVFRSDASIMGYRAFLSSRISSQSTQRTGGARRRAFENLKVLGCGLN